MVGKVIATRQGNGGDQEEGTTGGWFLLARGWMDAG